MKTVFCSECGAALDERDMCPNPSCPSYTPNVSSSDSRHKKAAEPIWKPAVFSEKGKLIVPDCVNPDLDEVPIKQYDIARLQTLIKGARAEGRLQVTNKRVLFRSSGASIVGPTSLQYEFSIEEVAGIEIRKEAHFNLLPTLLLILLSAIIISVVQPLFASVYNNEVLGTIFCVLLAIFSAFLFFLLRKRTFLRYLGMSVLITALPLDISNLVQTALGGGNNLQTAACVIGLLAFIVSLLYLAFAPNLVIRVLTKGGNSAVEIRRRDSIFSFQHNEYTGFAQVMPGPDTDNAIKEIGALLREVQQTGIYTEK